MSNVEKVHALLIKETQVFIKHFDVELAPTTPLLCDKLALDRTQLSKILNELYQNNAVIKINTRPVIYLSLDTKLQNKLTATFTDLATFKTAYNKLNEVNHLQKMIGWNGSLREPIDQMKAGLLYPNHGLPIIIFGPSGVGKSFFIKESYQYAKQLKVIEAEAPLVVVNCAQYANNPELLSSILFGYVKGAFTGAQADKQGALESADGGILFLDEVHRLSAEGQEKLFTYLDNGYFSPLGNDAKKIRVNVRLMFATTASRDNFLETFLRRVPIKIDLQSLEKRGTTEKRQIIDSFLYKESKQIDKPIEITRKALAFLYQHEYSANIGEAKNLVKYSVANAYTKHLDSEIVSVNTHNFPQAIYQQRSTELEQRIFIYGDKKVFEPTGEVDAKQNDMMTEHISKTWHYIEKMASQNILVRDKYISIINNMMDYWYFSIIEADDVIFKSIVREVQNIFKLLNYDGKFYNNHNLIYGIACYVYYILDSKNYRLNLEQIKNKELIALFNPEERFVGKLVIYIQKQFEINLSEMDILWLSMLVAGSKVASDLIGISAIILAHGYATASSIADTCNRMLQYPIYNSVDMLPDSTSDEIAESLKCLIQNVDPVEGLVIMIDMGSLSSIAEQVIKDLRCAVLLIDQVSTPIALEIGEQIRQKKNIAQIKEHYERMDNTPKLLFHEPADSKKNVIISTCMTGLGAAEQVKTLLNDSFTGIIDVTVLSCEFDLLKRQGAEAKMVSDYNILAVIGIDNPDIKGIPYLGLEDIISGTKITELRNILLQIADIERIKQVERLLMKNFSLTRIMDTLTIISPNKVINVVELFIETLIKADHLEINSKVKISLYIHIANMIERIIRKEPVAYHSGTNQQIERDTIFSVVKKEISVIEDAFIIKVDDAEIAYICDIIRNLK
ncbi:MULTISPECIES: sigma 54-interacting transcriptional regulator [Latilactobacillus]|uniref:sigma 54-interacting transcriptional regulator n=1 Tax=Latilactobacillus TaxID=2767885 RepID=UPI002243C90D|nr:sigma 54-interacting transcriptional regulator [Latilactobacillus curvatus]MCW8779202.1 sigma 54-interacting transcriptional regulator [Latilactobacillus curvatus]